MRRLFGVFCIAMTVAPSCTESKKDSAEAPATEGGGTGQTITVTGTVNLGAMEDDDAAVSLGAREVAIADAEGKTVAKSVTEPDGSYVVSMPGQLAIEPAAELALTEKRLTVRAVIADTPSETVFGVDDPIDLASGNFVQMGSQPMRKITAVRGRLLLDGARDHTGILVYVPGTHLQARTDSAGLFLLPFIPAGSYELRAERDGYLPKDLPGVEVADGETTKIAAAVLKLSGGTATFSVKQVGAEGLSPSRDVEFLITAGEADRFKAGLAAEVGNIAYGHVPEVYRHTFDADGEYDLAFVFANSDGFESTVTRRVIVDTEKPSPVGLRLADRDTLNVESSNERAVIPLHQTCADIASVAILVGAAAPRDDDFTWSCHTGGADSASSFTVPEGASTFAYTLWVRDRVGNVSAAGQAGSITIDMTPPAPRVITLNDQTSGSELGTDITTVYATVGSCVDTAKVLISESQLLPPLPAQFTTACTTAPNAFTYTFANNIAGVKTVLVWALDRKRQMPRLVPAVLAVL
jgi:hypothetical protein